jgi:hypothetical protein
MALFEWMGCDGVLLGLRIQQVGCNLANEINRLPALARAIAPDYGRR